MIFRSSKHLFTTIMAAMLVAAAPVLAEPPTYVEQQVITTSEIPGLNTNNSGFDLFEDRMVIGAAGEYNDFGVLTGAAYAYQLMGDVWVQKQRLVPDDYMSMFPEQKRFGQSVAIRPDTLIVGAPGDGAGDGLHTGAIYAYWDNVDTWELQTKFRREDDGMIQGWSNQKFGNRLDIDGNTMAVAVPGYIYEGSVRVFERTQGQWVFKQDIWLPYPDNYGVGVVDVDGDVLIAISQKPYNGSYHRSTLHVYHRAGDVWTHVQQLDPPDPLAAFTFWDAAVSGNRIAVGSRGWSMSGYQWAGMVYIFELTGDTWGLATQFRGPDASPYSSYGTGVSLLGDRLVVGNARTETVYVYDWNGSNWITSQVITKSMRDGFGIRSLLRDGALMVGGWDTFTIFEYDNAPPTANAGPDQTLQAIYADGSSDVTLDGSGSTDPDADPLTYSWTLGGQLLATGVDPAVTLALGTHTITLTVTDGQESASDDVVITVEATIAGLRLLLDEVVPQENLPTNSLDKMYRNLDDAEMAQGAVDFDKARELLDEFIGAVRKELKKGNISSDNARKLIDSATATQNALGIS